MRPLSRFTVAMLDIQHDHYVIDPTCGSGGFLLEVLLQVWNRRRTQTSDFESIEVCFPPDKEIQRSLIADVLEAKEKQKHATDSIGIAMLRFSDIIDGRGDEEFEAVFDDGVEEE